ncbi:MAG: cation diffusion facilitator family transporter [Oscillospiraceae bacterium]
MTELLLRLFIKDYQNTQSAKVRSAVGSMAGFVGIGCNGLLFTLKLIAGTLAGSVSITADALNNLSDASGSIVTLIGFKMAGKPADEHHPYGHARAEYLSALAVAMLILFIGFELVKSSAQKIFRPEAVEFSPLIGAILVISIAVKLWMALFNYRLSKRIDSAALAATSADSRNDCVATAAVLAAGLLETWLGVPLDGWIGLGVAAFILWSGWNLARDTVSMLLGQGADPTLREKIVDYIAAQPKVLGYHDLMVHDYGPGRQFASLHVEMDHREDSMECHELIDDMERECLRSHNVHLVIHYDPVVTEDPELHRLKARCAQLLLQQDPRLSLHDFRLIPGRRHMNLIFDVALPSDLRHRRRELPRELEEALRREDRKIYHVIINYDVAH